MVPYVKEQEKQDAHIEHGRQAFEQTTDQDLKLGYGGHQSQDTKDSCQTEYGKKSSSHR